LRSVVRDLRRVDREIADARRTPALELDDVEAATDALRFDAGVEKDRRLERARAARGARCDCRADA
jgi:hypothetical protein